MEQEDKIRARAHELWEQAGRPEGREQEFWLEAERELNAQQTPPEATPDNP